MTDPSTARRLRGAFRNAMVWGVAWGALGTAVTSIMRLTGGIPFPNALGDGLGMGIRIGVVGALAGTVFATFVSLAYRRRKLSEISALRFGIGGAVLAGLFVPVFMLIMNLVAGDPVPWSLITDDIVMATLFGGITAAGTMKLAQRAAADAPIDATERLEAADAALFPGAGASGFPAEQRTRAAERL